MILTYKRNCLIRLEITNFQPINFVYFIGIGILEQCWLLFCHTILSTMRQDIALLLSKSNFN